MRNAPPVPTTVPLPAPLEAVLDPTAVSPAGQKAFAVTLALAPPLVPGAKVTALVPPSKQRIAFVVPESVTVLLKFCVLVPASVELDRFALAEVRMEAPVVAPSMSSAGVPAAPSATTSSMPAAPSAATSSMPAAPSATTSSAGVPAATSAGPSAPSAPPPTVPPLPPPPPTVRAEAAAVAAAAEASRAVATALAAVSSSSASSAALPPAALPPAALPPAALPTPAESTVAIAPVPPPMMPAFAIPPRPVKPTPIPLPGAFEAMPQTNGKAPVGKVRVLVPLMWDDALMYGGAKLSVFVPRLAKSVLATLPPQRPTGGAVELALTLDASVGSAPFSIGPISIVSGPKPAASAPIVPMRSVVSSALAQASAASAAAAAATEALERVPDRVPDGVPDRVSNGVPDRPVVVARAVASAPEAPKRRGRPPKAGAKPRPKPTPKPTRAPKPKPCLKPVPNPKPSRKRKATSSSTTPRKRQLAPTPAPPPRPPVANRLGRSIKPVAKFGDKGELDGAARRFASTPVARRGLAPLEDELGVPAFANEGAQIWAMGLHAGVRKRFKARVLKVRARFPRLHVRYEANEEGATDALLLPEMKEAYLAADQVTPIE